jgi:starch synthase (maltosyl-transferring)
MGVEQICETYIGHPSRHLAAGPRTTNFSRNGSEAFPAQGRSRVAIENVTPLIDGGRHPIKRTVGERVVVEADLFCDSQASLSAVVKYRAADALEWWEVPMVPLANDRWRGEFTVTNLGLAFYTIEGWVDRFKTWRDAFRKKAAAGQNIDLELLTGVKLIQEAASIAEGEAAERLNKWAGELAAGDAAQKSSLVELALDPALAGLMARHSERAFVSSLGRELRIVVDPRQARFSAWYEMFPRSFSPKAGGHGSFKDCEAQLPRITKMGFDVLYLPPIHPIGRSSRKGKNNNPVCQTDEPGSPWAIGAAEGGHKAVHPMLGTLDDFRRLVGKARSLGLEIALDIAFQCSPDHPYLREHPE